MLDWLLGVPAHEFFLGLAAASMVLAALFKQEESTLKLMIVSVYFVGLAVYTQGV